MSTNGHPNPSDGLVRLVIEYDPRTGQLQVHGPSNIMLALGMLEMAKTLVPKLAERPVIEVPKLSVLPPTERN